MKYLVEINTDTEKGAQLLKYIDGLNADDTAIHILHEPALTAEAMVVAGTRPSANQLAAFLKPDDNEKEYDASEAFEVAKRELKKRAEIY